MNEKIEAALAWARSLQLRAPVSAHHIRATSELWPLIESLSIHNALEVGCGEPPGLIVPMLQAHGIEAIGLDGLSRCDAPGDMHDLPFEDNTFDLVCSRHSLEHVLIPYLALMEMSRVSRAWLLVVVPVDSDKAQNWSDHLWCLGRKGWELMFQKLNLDIEHFEEGDHTEQWAKESGAWVDYEWRYLLRKEG